MNNAKIWLVVSPQVGLPIFLGAVAIGSFAVHVAVLSKTNWYEDYLVGKPLGGTEQAAATIQEMDTATSNLAGVTARDLEGQTITVTLPDGTQAVAVIERPLELAADTRASGRAQD